MLVQPGRELNMTRSRTFVAIAAGTLLLGVSPAHAQHRGGERSRGAASGVAVRRPAPVIVGPRVVGVAPVPFYRPYYAFRPRVSIGFGLYAGFPIAYPYYYGYYSPYYSPYGYASPYPGYPYRGVRVSGIPVSGIRVSRLPLSRIPVSRVPVSTSRLSRASHVNVPPASSAPGSVGVQRGQSQANTGGLSFEITPGTAEVFLDGSYVGTVGQFTPTTQPLGVTPGRHRIEIRAQGYRTLDFDVDIVAGQVIPYRGVMER